jgi:hypothetical protein
VSRRQYPGGLSSQTKSSLGYTGGDNLEIEGATISKAAALTGECQAMARDYNLTHT